MLNQITFFNNYTTTDYIRFLIIVAGYILLRPRIMGMVKNYQTKQMIKREREELEKTRAARAKGELEEPEDEKVASSIASGSGSGWGTAARSRANKQKKVLQSAIDKQEEMELVNESDEEIADLLVPEEEAHIFDKKE
ncbi:hypothetical protein B0I72DRAFT_139834 [Yarrowia lipolytica]|jgi:hypothetical protein|uniref:YALI0D07766p n=2 Tax=Yarrowia lipolytica TaxID=4952 RepID=Q6C9W6_YARLI|nr:YALI0D07766p [Yarrowia lipolytica CLIB122]AOW03748.1 hypothetical protein YALI1_D10022g [Yarrowia lipolytica]KAB8284344.1 hypothetical protein BKA91DRAFT_135192 [Yarrowia lipolytica]KAE8172680.1 hypothetical protein BKA90DRAFT_137078 [Yarrowia lipolytica]KAJ8054661.1 hypothetical protein LXG23DRAFT_56217 [Yarrowia lipolytica]QNP97704.1 Hypothetical protein YALI2_D00145g [Yarrowia lipolytica]|eukprot:XP_502546.1 YALI0D07766p [Yarrowia lipolytica CLIB122]